jgi:hypothetical protein
MFSSGADRNRPDRYDPDDVKQPRKRNGLK